ncbi:hypothetical protein IPM44_00040 [bacterium]|nr:MAG: hypothetical protein IPM44_00040 [bacterium]
MMSVLQNLSAKLYLAAEASNIPLPTYKPAQFSTGPADVQSIINNSFTFLMWAVGVVGVVMIIYSGFMFVISAGRPDRAKLAIQSIIYTCVGFVIAILARSIVAFLLPVAQSSTNVQGMVGSGIQLFLWAIGVAGVVMVVVAGLLYIFSAGDPGKTKAAKDAILYALIGIGVAVLGSAIIGFVSAQFR